MRIGIVTHYYENYNYGGNLQAMALCHYLNAQREVCAEQIPCKMSERSLWQRLSVGKLLRAPQKLWGKVCRRLMRAKQNEVTPLLAQRRAAIAPFNAAIPHADTLLDPAALPCDDGGYDLYITGSDQVWNPDACTPLYRLDFVREGVPKISYAASVSRKSLRKGEREVMKASLASYAAVSVREQDAVALLRDLSPVPVEWVLDPVFLLSREQWEAIADAREQREPYLFCYFLGEEQQARDTALAYAKAHGLRIVTLPYLEGRYRKSDAAFGDEMLFDVSPARFLSLIQNASCVMTDSFHALAFCAIFERPYFVFDRTGAKAMESRLLSLLQMLEQQGRFLHTKAQCTLDYMDAQPTLTPLMQCRDFAAMRDRSVAFLARFVGGVQ